MSEIKEVPIESRPRLIPSLTMGFNTVASHIYLILPPLILDLFLWLGPHLRLYKLLKPGVDEAFNLLLGFASPTQLDGLKSSQQLFSEFLQNFNLFNTLSTLPIGLPSLMSVINPSDSPLADLQVSLQLGSTGFAVGIWLLCVLVGIAIGSLYFGAISRATDTKPNRFQSSAALIQAGQAILYTIILVVLLLMLIIPAIAISSVLALISPFLGQVALVGAGMLLIWMMVPLIFTPLGIFANKQNAVNSIMTTTQLVRGFMPGAGWFILVVGMLGFGLDMLWVQPQINSWLMLVGIAGHAFIYTAIIAAAFTYYRHGISWMERSLRKAALQQTSG